MGWGWGRPSESGGGPARLDDDDNARRPALARARPTGRAGLDEWANPVTLSQAGPYGVIWAFMAGVKCSP